MQIFFFLSSRRFSPGSHWDQCQRLMVFDLLLLAKYHSKDFSDCCLQGVLARWLAAWNLVRVLPEYGFSVFVKSGSESESESVSESVSESEYVSILFANRWVQKELRSYKNLFYPLESIIRLGFMKHPTSSFNVSGHRKLKSRSPQEVQKWGGGGVIIISASTFFILLPSETKLQSQV